MGRSPTSDDLLGLVRMLDRSRGRHCYGVGATPPGELVGELGALHAHDAPGRAEVRLTSEGRLVTDSYVPRMPRPGPHTVGRWLAAPLTWRGFAAPSARLRAVLWRAKALPRCLRARREDHDARPAGWIEREPGPLSIALFSAVHPVTGDQLLTTNRWEAVDLGYVGIDQIGYLEARAPLTGSAGTARPELIWASRFGQAVRTDGQPRDLSPRGAIAGPDRAAPPFTVSGWALAPRTSVARVEVFAAGAAIGSARLGLDRGEVARESDHVDAPVCGFDYVVRADDLPVAESVRIAAQATGLDGNRFDVGEIEVAVDRPASADDVMPRAEELRERARALCRSVTAAKSTRTNVLVVAHSLQLGGAGLWLHEVIERLAEHSGMRFTVVAAADGPLREPLEALEIPVHVTDAHPLHGMQEYEGRLAELAAWAAPQGFDVAVVNTLRAFPGVEVADLLGIPSVLAIHESYHLDVWWLVGYPPGAVHPYVKRRGESALGRATAVLFEADATRRLFAHHGDAARFIALPYGIELEEIDRHRQGFDRDAARRRLGLELDAQLILCLGQVEPRKGQGCLAQAFRAIADRHPTAVLALVGESPAPGLAPFNAALRDHVARAGLAARVRIVPPATPPYEWLGAADVLVCASDVESLPRVVLEAMAFEVPVLSTRIFGVPEVIEHERTGWLCAPRDVGALARALDHTLSAAPARRAEIAREARAAVLANHDPAPYVDRFAALLDGLAADPAADPNVLLGLQDGQTGSSASARSQPPKGLTRISGGSFSENG